MQDAVRRLPDLMEERKQIQADIESIDRSLAVCRPSDADLQLVKDRLETTIAKRRRNEVAIDQASNKFPQTLLETCPDKSLNKKRLELLQEKKTMIAAVAAVKKEIEITETNIVRTEDQIRRDTESKNVDLHTDRIAESKATLSRFREVLERQQAALVSVQSSSDEVVQEIQQVKQEMIFA
ncbi:hypothetical protein [Gimesia algae]|nr:hypothetical protein [Gimesia algae]